MNADTYNRLSSPFRGKPTRIKMIQRIDKILTSTFYVLYPLLLVLLLIAGPEHSDSLPFNPLLLPCIIVPGVGFFAVSLLRRLVNAPRPYEALEIDPLIHKETKGQSFPSKHTFSSFAIAFCWMRFCLPLGIVLFFLACCIATIRVIGGVHFPRDVIAAAALACLCGIALLVW